MLVAFIAYSPLLCFSKNLDKDKKIQVLTREIEKAITEAGKNINIGIYVQEINSEKILYKKNAEHYFNPASNEKLFIAFAALRYLGPDFTYSTNLYVDPTKIHDGTLEENIYFKFGGDPTFTFQQLDKLIASLSQAGIKHIHGNIIVDDTTFDDVFMSPGTSWDDAKFCFGAPLSAIIVDHNCINATIAPAKTLNQPALVSFPDQPQFIDLINQVTTHASVETSCALELKFTDEKSYTISGCIKNIDAPKELLAAIINPRVNLSAALKYLLAKNAIAYTKKIEFQKLPSQAKLFASEKSKPIKELITTMLKDSDNLIANSLFKTVGAVYSHKSGSWQNGNDAMRNILIQSIKLNIPKTTLVDGAGASRYNYLTPQQIITLLTRIYSSNEAPFIFAALPISGVDGTLKNRMNNPELLGKVHAKTGTETAVTSLSGYLTTNKKKTLAFSILINGFVDLPSNYKKLEDQICEILIKNY